MLQDSLVVQETHNLFILYDREDITMMTIGRPKHPGCVHNIGNSWGL